MSFPPSHTMPPETCVLSARCSPSTCLIALEHWQPGMTQVGFFAVKKDDKLRLITDGRPANVRRLGGLPLDVRLPTPEDFADLHVPLHSRLSKFKHDVSAMFHRFVVPRWLQLLFCLAPLTPAQLRVLGRDPHGPNVPVLRTLAMGWVDAVYLMQSVMERLMSRVISPSRFLTAGARLEQGPILAIYIDDTIGCGLSPRDDRLMTYCPRCPRCCCACRLCSARELPQTCGGYHWPHGWSWLCAPGRSHCSDPEAKAG
jgi:hypothetical protein